MENPNSGSQKRKQLNIASLIENEEKFLKDALHSDEVFRSITKMEEVILQAINQASGDMDSPSRKDILAFREEVDLAKAEHLLNQTEKKPLPEYLKRYTELNLEKPTRKNSLVVRITQAGIQVFDSLSLGLNLKPSLAISPELRSAVAESIPSTSNDAGFVVFEEKIQNGQKFFYQMVRETPKEVFLSIKLDGEESQDLYRQVILRRDGRFILSNKLNSEGIVNFSGLLEGSYSVEFIGGGENKVIDLYLILD